MIAAYTHGEEWLDRGSEYIDENIAYVHDFLQKICLKLRCQIHRERI